MTAIDLDAVDAKRKAALEVLGDLCENPKSFRMSVPVRETDSDTVLADALRCLRDVSAELRAAQGRIAGLEAGVVKYCVVRHAVSRAHDICVEERTQRDNSRMWAVTQTEFVLSRDGEWEWEPQPSSRTDEFIARTRFASLDAAIAAARAAQEG